MRSRRWAILAIPAALIMVIAVGVMGCPKAAPETSCEGLTGWELVLCLAENEGEVALYTSLDATSVLPHLKPAMEELYGITVYATFAGNTTSLAKLKAERAANTIVADVVNLNPQSIVGVEAFLQAYSDLPELLDDSVEWIMDPVLYSPLQLNRMVPHGIMVNTDLVPPGEEPQDWEDLADPKWAAYDIAIQALSDYYAGNLPSHLLYANDAEWLEDWYNAVETVNGFQPGTRSAPMEVAQGETAMYVTSRPHTAFELLEMDPTAPVAWYIPESGGVGGISNMEVAVKDSPHPNAAQVLLNYLLTEDAQTMLGEHYTIPVRKGVDVVYDYQVPATANIFAPYPPTLEFLQDDTSYEIYTAGDWE